MSSVAYPVLNRQDLNERLRVIRRDAYAAQRLIADAFERTPLAGIADVEDAVTTLRSVTHVPAAQERLQLVHAVDSLDRASTSGVLFEHDDGMTFRVAVSPGTIGVSRFDAVRREATAERSNRRARTTTATALSLYVDERGDLVLNDVKPSREIHEWSAKSRARMFTTIPQLDLAEWSDEPGTLAMVTVTLSGNWEVLTPTGATFKAMIKRFRARFEDNGLVWRCLWKLEFQHRGAPHMHFLMRIPVMVGCQSHEPDAEHTDQCEPFDDWLARTWADVVAHGAPDEHKNQCLRCTQTVDVDGCLCSNGPDTHYRRHLLAGTGVDLSGERYSDPRRIATYFLGHSSKHTDGKEYQHIVPALWRAAGAGPGRFWGYAGLDKGTVEIDLELGEWFVVRRMLRKIAKARAYVNHRRAIASALRAGRPVPVDVNRSQTGRLTFVPEGRSWSLRSLGHRGRLVGGTVVVNDGVALAYDIARALSIDGLWRCEQGL